MLLQLTTIIKLEMSITYQILGGSCASENIKSQVSSPRCHRLLQTKQLGFWTPYQLSHEAWTHI